jgi:predicted ATPase
MQELVPGIESIDVRYQDMNRLGLLFNEEPGNRAWSSDDVSDGTIRTLAFLVALVDPRSTALVIEELENSAHPWLIKTIIGRLREMSQLKPIVLTTHSPVVVDAFQPNETWVVFKKRGESQVKNILDIDPSVGASWEQGKFALSDYLDSGLLPHAVPGGDL